MQPFCCGKAISITYTECAFAAFGVQHAMRMRHFVICVFFHIIS
jgi:hypothetical protein